MMSLSLVFALVAFGLAVWSHGQLGDARRLYLEMKRLQDIERAARRLVINDRLIAMEHERGIYTHDDPSPTPYEQLCEAVGLPCDDAGGQAP